MFRAMERQEGMSTKPLIVALLITLWSPIASAYVLEPTPTSLDNGWCSYAGGQLLVGNFDGDSYTDVLCHDRASGYNWLSQARSASGWIFAGNTREWASDWCKGADYELTSAKLRPGALQEALLCRHRPSGAVLISRASSNFTRTDSVIYSAFCPGDGQLIAGSFDGKGDADLACYDPVQKVLRLAYATTSPPTQMTQQIPFDCSGLGRQLLRGDFDGDWVDDLMCFNNGSAAKGSASAYIDYGKAAGWTFDGVGRLHYSTLGLTGKRDWSELLPFGCRNAVAKVGNFDGINGDDLACVNRTTGNIQMLFSGREEPFVYQETHSVPACSATSAPEVLTGNFFTDQFNPLDFAGKVTRRPQDDLLCGGSAAPRQQFFTSRYVPLEFASQTWCDDHLSDTARVLDEMRKHTTTYNGQTVCTNQSAFAALEASHRFSSESATLVCNQHGAYARADWVTLLDGMRREHTKLSNACAQSPPIGYVDAQCKKSTSTIEVEKWGPFSYKRIFTTLHNYSCPNDTLTTACNQAHEYSYVPERETYFVVIGVYKNVEIFSSICKTSTTVPPSTQTFATCDQSGCQQSGYPVSNNLLEQYAFAGEPLPDGSEQQYLFADLGGDRRADVVQTYRGWHSMPLCIATAGGNFSCEDSPAAVYDANSVEERFSLADLTGDGLPEVLATYRGWQSIPACSANMFDWTCQNYPATIYDSGSPEQQFLTGDFDGDHLADVVQTYRGWHSMPVCSSTGGGFSCWNAPATIFDSGSSDQRFITGDFNGDQYTDILQFYLGWQAMPLCHLGLDGSWDCQLLGATVYNAGTPEQQVLIGDVDGGGDDVIQAYRGWHSLPVCSLRNGTWSCRNEPADIYDWGSDEQQFLIGDFNGDGRADVAQTYRLWHSIPVCLSTGTGWSCSNLPADIYDSGSRQQRFHVVDTDGNGSMEIVSTYREWPAYPVCTYAGSTWSCTTPAATVYDSCEM
jgi:hypothetical protein